MTRPPQRYARISSIGFGAMGEVWLAQDEILRRTVAVKQLRVDPSRGIDNHAVERMVREARIAASLHHRHIVSVFDLYTVDGQPNIVMEFVNGESLAQRIRRGPALPVVEVARFGAQIASALGLAHERGVVHRDVKPANILLEPGGDAKLADFGIAHGLEDIALTDTGNMIGTIAFMAPEVARTGHASAASDLWSLGATLFAALEGRSPYDDGSNPNTTQLLIRLVTEPAPASTRAGEIAPLLARMMNADPAARPPAYAVAATLAGFAENNGQGASALAVANDELPLPGARVGLGVEPGTRLRQVVAEPTRQSAESTTPRAAPSPITEPARTPHVGEGAGQMRRGQKPAWIASIAVLCACLAVGAILLTKHHEDSGQRTAASNTMRAGSSFPSASTGLSSSRASSARNVQNEGRHDDLQGDSVDPDIYSVRYTVNPAGVLTLSATLADGLSYGSQLNFDLDTDGKRNDGADKLGCHSTAFGADYELSLDGNEKRARISRISHCVVLKDGSNSIEFDQVGTVAVAASDSTYTIRISRSKLHAIARPGLAVLTAAQHAFADDAPDNPHQAYYPASVASN